MPVAYSLLPDRFADGRHEAIHRGLERAGWTIRHGAPAGRPERDDVLVSWNLYANAARQAAWFRRTLVCEEGYVRRAPGIGETYFAIALGGHNGSGRWYPGDEARVQALGLEFAPWRAVGEHILVCGQRGFGYGAMAMPDAWPDAVYRQLRRRTERPLWYRPHPKRARRLARAPYDRIVDFEAPLTAQLENCWAVVVFTSNAATEALMRGVPVCFLGPHLVSEGAAARGLGRVTLPELPDRRRPFERLAWAQWHLGEIRAGLPFRHLLSQPSR